MPTDTISRRLGITVRLDMKLVETLEELARIDNVRPTKKAEMILVEYLNTTPVNTHD